MVGASLSNSYEPLEKLFDVETIICDVLGQRFAVHILHSDECLVICLYSGNVGMVEFSSGFRFDTETT
jgi:hypothetical protein